MSHIPSVASFRILHKSRIKVLYDCAEKILRLTKTDFMEPHVARCRRSQVSGLSNSTSHWVTTNSLTVQQEYSRWKFRSELFSSLPLNRGTSAKISPLLMALRCRSQFFTSRLTAAPHSQRQSSIACADRHKLFIRALSWQCQRSVALDA